MTLRVENVGAAAVLTIDRPATRNAIDHALATRIGEAVRVAVSDPSVRGIVLTGAGSDTFVSGGDLKEFVELARRGVRGDEMIGMFTGLGELETCELPVIAAVQGNVFGGGCEMLLLCDMVIMETHASLGFKHAKMGLSPAWGGVTRLCERIGPLETARLLYTAEQVSAPEAMRLGLVNEVCEKYGARARAITRVNRIADNPRTTVSAIKRALREVREARRGAALERERSIFAEVWGAPEHQRAMDEFLAKK